MVRSKLQWMILSGLLATIPWTALGQTWKPAPPSPSPSALGVSLRLTDQSPVAVQVGYQEQEPSAGDNSGSDKNENTEKAETEIDRNGLSDGDESASNNLDALDKSDEKETSLADSFPVANLRGGINDNSLQRAIAKREIADPNMEFLTAAAFAPTEYQGYAPQVWKTWESPNVRYRPLYFEDENLERYGNSVGHHLQPYKSGVHFISRVVTLPYQMAAQGTRDCEYGLGYFRPGNCNPAYRQQFQLSRRGVVAQALTLGLFLGL